MHARVITNCAPSPSPSIVLVHGLGVSSRYMMPTAELLSPHARVFAPDLPGFGLSLAPRRALSIPELADALALWMQASGIERAVLVGNSLGAQIIVDFAVRYPEFVSQAVLIAPTIDPQARRFMRQVTRLLRDGLREPLSLLPIVIGDYLRTGLRRGARTLKFALRDKIEDKLPLMQTRTLVVRGGRDPIVPQGWMEEATRLLPRARLVVIAPAAHAVNYNSPDALVREVLLFINDEGGTMKDER
jgi:pimeloyl-ACP methyl ester carboxylesterase